MYSSLSAPTSPSRTSPRPSSRTIHQVLACDFHPDALSSHLDRMRQPVDLSGQITLINVSVHSGGYGDVHRGTLKRGNGTYIMVAVKVLQPPKKKHGNPSMFNKKLRREIQVWKRLDHDNIVPLLGITFGHYPPVGSSSMGMVSPWMENGSLITFMGAENLCISQRLQILSNVAAGLTYLHSKGIIHGDLTGANVLINDTGKACLADFGLSSIKVEFEGTSYFSTTVGGAIRWRAPELLPPNGDVRNFVPNLTPACDIYSLGNVALHVLSGKVPYYNITQDICVLAQLFYGNRPERPPVQMLTNDYWEFIVHCWGDTPDLRPCAEEVYNTVSDLINSTLSQPLMPLAAL